MKNVSFIVALFLSAAASTPAFGQDGNAEKNVLSERNNILKINASALFLKNISLQFERKISRKFTVALGAHTLPFGKIPFKGFLKAVINDPSVPIDDFRVGASGVTPEIRWYVGKKGAFRGFYIGAFASFNRYKTDLPVQYDNDTKTGVFNGTLKSVTGGIQLGAQWKLSERLYLDWWIIGPNYGQGTGRLAFAGALTQADQDDIRQAIADIRNDFPTDPIENIQVNSQGASIDVKGPWLGIRGMGINFGFRF